MYCLTSQEINYVENKIAIWLIILSSKALLAEFKDWLGRFKNSCKYKVEVQAMHDQAFSLAEDNENENGYQCAPIKGIREGGGLSSVTPAAFQSKLAPNYPFRKGAW